MTDAGNPSSIPPTSDAPGRTDRPRPLEAPMSLFSALLLIVTCLIWIGLSIAFGIVAKDAAFFEGKQPWVYTLTPVFVLLGVAGLVLAWLEIRRRWRH